MHDQSEIRFDNAYFENNSAPNLGGPIVVQEQAKLLITNSYFKNNRAPDGSVIWAFDVFQVPVTLINCTFEENSALFTMIDFSYSNLNMINCTFINNINPVIYLKSSNVTISNFKAINNTCDTLQLGCIISSDGFSTMRISSFFVENMKSFRTEPGALYLIDSKLTIEKSHFSHCSSIGFGTCIYAQNSDINITQTNFSNYYPSCIYLYEGNLSLNEIQMSNSFLINSPLISFYSENIHIMSSIFFNNTGDDQGGALFFQNNANSEINKAFIKYCNFSNNSAIYNGGSIVLNNQYAELFKCSFFNNTALYGGAIYFKTDSNSSAELIMNEIYFEANRAFKEGGAIKSTFNLPHQNKTFNAINNKASYGNNFASYPLRIGFQVYEGLLIILNENIFI